MKQFIGIFLICLITSPAFAAPKVHKHHTVHGAIVKGVKGTAKGTAWVAKGLAKGVKKTSLAIAHHI